MSRFHWPWSRKKTPRYSLGKLDPKPIEGLKCIKEYETSALPSLPASVKVPNGNYQLDGNGPDPAVTIEGSDFQGCGDCTFVGMVNLDRAWNVEVSETLPIPSANETVKEYFSFTGGVDSGAAETSVLSRWKNRGFFGYKIDAFAPVDHTSLTAIKESIAFYGGCYFGVQLPESAQQQFDTSGHAVWSVVPRSPIEGGHCVVGLGYDNEYVQIVTWGAIVNVEFDWLDEYLDEAYAIVGRQFVARGVYDNLDLATLLADLNQV